MCRKQGASYWPVDSTAVCTQTFKPFLKMTGAEKQSQKEVKKTNLLNFGNAFETFTDSPFFLSKKKFQI